MRRTIEQRIRWIEEEVERHLSNRSGIRLLEIGCGDGLMMTPLRRPGVDLWGCDLNLLRLRRTRVGFPEARLALGEIGALGFRDGVFDGVLASQVLEHVRETDSALRELRRILKPGGRLWLGVPNEGCRLGRLRNRWVQPKILKQTDHLHFFTEPALRRKIEAAGFEIRSVFRENFFIPHTRLFDWCHWPAFGWRLMQRLAAVWPGQCAGFYLACEQRGPE
ncbi:MAG: hypothetical protein COV76_01555 [Candidatus Omnitrophica bacterium CG11_big_fil_rev_8_21_14_0_20_64_10]|nr:MAG: hypothetical protein COV76_01555 [Candidatus Omnitrophica bacterium CG11_big_fil_rev_8_21_14_0_20_64_10]